jgi:hypothetical protein
LFFNECEKCEEKRRKRWDLAGCCPTIPYPYLKTMQHKRKVLLEF